MPERVTSSPKAWPCEGCPGKRGPLARTGPKARKAPTGAICPSGSLPRPRRGPVRDVLGARASRPQRAEGPRSDDRSHMPERVTPPPKAWLWEGCPGSAGLWPAPGRRPAKCRQERHARAGHSPAQGRGYGSDVLGARASGPHRAEGPQGADRSDMLERVTSSPKAWLWEGWGVLERGGLVRLPMWRACGPLRARCPRSQAAPRPVLGVVHESRIDRGLLHVAPGSREVNVIPNVTVERLAYRMRSRIPSRASSEL